MCQIPMPVVEKCTSTRRNSKGEMNKPDTKRDKCEETSCCRNVKVDSLKCIEISTAMLHVSYKIPNGTQRSNQFRDQFARIRPLKEQHPRLRNILKFSIDDSLILLAKLDLSLLHRRH